MGQEVTCRLQYGGAAYSGRAYLESDYLLFRGDVRVKIFFREMTSIDDSNGVLRVRGKDVEAAFELGAYASRWKEKILHPPSRVKKLGIRAEMRVRLMGKVDDDFREELKAVGAEEVEAEADLVFVQVMRTAELKTILRLQKEMRRGNALWILFPKGVEAIREVDVIHAGRGAGLKDTKVVAFSKTLTALRFLKS